MSNNLRYMMSGAMSDNPKTRELWLDAVLKDTGGRVPSDPNPFPYIRLFRKERHAK